MYESFGGRLVKAILGELFIGAACAGIGKMIQNVSEGKTLLGKEKQDKKKFDFKKNIVLSERDYLVE